MKVLIVSDAVSDALYTPHLRTVGAEVEAILSCGDLPYEYLEYLVTTLNVPLYYVRGNHDGRLLRADGRESDGPEGGRSIDGRVARVAARSGQVVWIAGFGGSGRYCGGGYERSEREMRRSVRRVGAELRWRKAFGRVRLDVAVSHAAPRGVHDGDDPCHRGFESFLALMRSHTPTLWVHGHVHPSYGVDLRPVRVGRTDVRGVYGYAILEVG